MLRFLLTRLLRAAVTIVLVVTFAFVVLRLSGDPAQIIMGADAPPEAVEAFRTAWGLFVYRRLSFRTDHGFQSQVRFTFQHKLYETGTVSEYDKTHPPKFPDPVNPTGKFNHLSRFFLGKARNIFC